MALDGPQAAVAAVLSRGHTIDRLNSSGLQEIVKQIESLKLQDENNAIEPATKKPKQGSEQLSDKKEDDEGKEKTTSLKTRTTRVKQTKLKQLKLTPRLNQRSSERSVSTRGSYGSFVWFNISKWFNILGISGSSPI